MVKREEVEALLRVSENYPSGSDYRSHANVLAELARTWLRVNDAPVVLATEWIWENVPEELEGQRVKLVLVPEAGGGEGNGYWPELPKNGGHDWTGHD